MGKEKDKMADFGIGTFRVGRLDGTGEPVEVPITPSCLIRTVSVGEKSRMARINGGYFQALFALAAAGRLGDFGVECPDLDDAKAVEAAVLELFDVANFHLEGEGGEGEEDPTSAS